MRFRDTSKNHDPPPIYDQNGNELTICFHVNGVLDIGTRSYIGGSVYTFDYVNKNVFSVDSLKRFTDYVGHGENQTVFYSSNEGEFELIDGQRVLNVLFDKAVKENKELNIYTSSSFVELDAPREVGGKVVDVGTVGVEDVYAEKESSSSQENDKNGKKIVTDDDSCCSSMEDCDYREVLDCVLFGGNTDDCAYSSSEDEQSVDDGSGEENVMDSEDDFNSVKASDSEDDDFNRANAYDSESDGDGCSIFNPNTPQMKLKMLFRNKWEFIDAVHSDAVLSKCRIKITKNDNERVYAKCKGEGCEWKIHAKKVPDEPNFQIRTFYDMHTCSGSYHIKRMKSKRLSGSYGYDFKNDPERKLLTFKNDLSCELVVDISHHMDYKSNKMSLDDQVGNADFQYTLLWDYAQEIERTNLGSTVLIGIDHSSGVPLFDRMYICLNALKKGFLVGCRPFIGVDGCHLKGPHGGILLSAVGVDPNNNIFPIAYAVVVEENVDTWDWFLTGLKNDLKIANDSEWTFISDKQKGLVQTFQSVFPNASHRFCVKSLYSKLKNASFRGEAFKTALYKASKETTKNEYNKRFHEIKELSEMLAKWLSDTPPENWSRSHFNCIPKCDMVLNNICESFNAAILPAREMPILSMLEWIMDFLRDRFKKNRDRANKGKKWKGLLCPKIQSIIDENVKKIGSCVPIKADGKQYHIRCFDGTQYIVDLVNSTCGCRKWDLTGIPCIHAIKAIYCEGLKPEDFTHAFYRVSTYKKVYESCIMPIKATADWTPTGLIPPLPPKNDREAGTSPKARRRELGAIVEWKERSSNNPYRLKRRQVTLKCSCCHTPGHNKRSCKSFLLPNTESQVQHCLRHTEEPFITPRALAVRSGRRGRPPSRRRR